MDLAQAALHEDDEGQDNGQHHQNANDHAGADSARTALAQELSGGGGDLGDDAYEDDERDAVADAAAGDLLAEPHQEHGATDEGDDAGDEEEDARIRNQIAGLEACGQRICLERGQNYGTIAGILVELLAAGLAFLLQLLPRLVHGAHQLNDDRGGNIGHDPEGKDAHPAQRAAGKHRQDAADA